MLKRINNGLKKIKMKKYDNLIKNCNNIDFTNKKNEDIKEILLNTKKQEERLAAISELSFRFLQLRPFNSQLKGSLVLYDGNIAEMKTGEGKTLSIIVTLILNFLEGKNAHVVTANDYLVERDYSLSKPLFEFLGIKSARLIDGQELLEKQDVYKNDIVYSTSKNLVFDYLYNNRFTDEKFKFNEKRDFVIIDEVDFVLIDEARTPIILSGILETDKELYKTFQLIQSHFVGKRKIDENAEIDPDFIYDDDVIEITDKGLDLLEEKLIDAKLISTKEELYANNGVKYIKSLERALKVNYQFKEDIHYLKENGEIVIINLQTGRPQRGRRFSDGIHQALEAKENFEIQNDAKALGQTTLQNYFKKYNKLSGTTGTALTEELEFREFYNLNVYEIETNKKMIRIDSNDLLFLNKTYMYKALIKDIKNNIEKGAPTLIGTQSVSESEEIAKRLRVEGIQFNLLNAKNHEKEAYVIQQAGKSGVVTIATNMAGRGTDIMLGGNKDVEIENFLLENASKTKEDAIEIWKEEHDKVIDAGGLQVIGVGRSESRRFDNQLIGRSGRQGDVGFTKFYLTIEDQLFANMNTNLLRSQWEKENKEVGISFGLLTKIVRESQKAYENNSFNMRKSLLQFDNINTTQREIFYDWRNKIVSSSDLSKITQNYLFDVIQLIVKNNITNESFYANNFDLIDSDFENILNLKIDSKELSLENKIEDDEELIETINKYLLTSIKEKMAVLSKEDTLMLEKEFLLRVMDLLWADNISNLEQMRSHTSLRAYAQKNPIDEYQQEALEMFNNLISDVKKDYINLIIKFSPMSIQEHQENIEKAKQEKLKNEKINNDNAIEIDASKTQGLPKYMKNIGM